ncbi:MAG: hypothetical protein L0227_06030 [Chloroflexi bacterium]|nr:hypothetical protein [Chloroflexota bacterium]
MNIARECGTKQGFLSKSEAKRVAQLMRTRHREAVHQYRCPHCGLRHVGHRVPAPLRAAVQRFSTRRAWQVEAAW